MTYLKNWYDIKLTKIAAFKGMHVSPEKNSSMCDYQESVITEQTDGGQSDRYVTLCFASDIITMHLRSMEANTKCNELQTASVLLVTMVIHTCIELVLSCTNP